ncbi:MAG TPA: MotA/TolQ/ExbB proton channel family protein [Rhodanobacteraceae bacterium]|jgi:biopolymer transport protein ExbB|nr:MotA/TolQ/ExbB proton channel family protein [Rhodanobacteraceae bacterium]
MIQAAIAAAAAAGTTNAQALTKVGASEFIGNIIEHPLTNWADAIVLIVLVVMSIWSWYYIVSIAIRNAQIRSRMGKVIQKFWDTPSAQDAVRVMEKQPRSEPFSKIALDAASAAAHHQRHEGSRMVEALNRSEFVDRALRQGVDRESRNLEGGLTVLATVGSAAVFVGLLGTVIGIYRALIALGASGESSISAVAGPVGECLIMTAIGLAAAIPAVIAYNAYSRANRVTIAHFDEFAHDLHDFFATGARVETGSSSMGARPAAAATPPAAKK